MKQKLLIVRSSVISTWGSCKVISPNLQACYNESGEDFSVEYFDLPEVFLKKEVTQSDEILVRLAGIIKKNKPDRLIFVDHLPTAAKILSLLLFHIPLKNIPSLLIHIYGDFTFFANEWFIFGNQFKGHPVKFLVASESQKRLLNYFSHDSVCIEKFLFPVDEKDYYFDPAERKATREEMGISENEKIILYSGRISQQKNVSVLIEEFQKIHKKSPYPVQLWIAGAFDDMGASFMGVKTYDGYMFSQITQQLNSMPECSGSVRFLGQLKKEKLRKIKNASDMFISLSLYHDEDYGMSPAEALATGLPSLLTDWGGYSSFASDSWDCFLVPVEITPYGHKLQTAEIMNFYLESLADTIEDRERRSKTFLKEFSVKANTVKLSEFLKKDFKAFSGFQWNLKYFSSEYWSVQVGKELSKQLTPSSENFYGDVYRNYISSNFK